MPDEKPDSSEPNADEKPAAEQPVPKESEAAPSPAATTAAQQEEMTSEGAPAGELDTAPAKPRNKKKKKTARAAGAATAKASATAGETAEAAQVAASEAAGEAFLFPRAPTFKPARVKLRDILLTAIPAVLLGAIFSVHGDVVFPRGEDHAHPLSHYQSLWHSGHVPGAVIYGIILVFLTTIGILGLLGDSPLDLRGDETTVANDGSVSVWWKREGTWLVGFCVLLYVPLAGAFGLWDPWETHYSEVAREILARDDWITLWWGQEGWFMSKPILIFWMSALGMGLGSTFGLPFWRDMGPSTHEWYIRLPIIFLAIGAVYAVYRAVRSAWGPRAGLLSGMVLATMPHWCFLAHQAMTDMPFVAPLVIAVSFLMMAVVASPEEQVRGRAVTVFGRTFRISMWHLCVGAILMVALPQVLYLLTRPMLLGCADDADRSCQAVLAASRLGGHIQLPIEQYWSGSAGNSMLRDQASTVPGSPPWEDRYNQIPFMTSFVQGLIWTALGALLMWTFRRERRRQCLAFSMMYLFGAISFMGKGPAGLGLPEIILFGFMIVTARWTLLPRIRVFQGIGIYLLCGFPWYIAIYCRLGNEFFDRFVVHDLLNRAFAGVHGDTGTFRYFVWQLGYAMFPWTGLAPAALVGWRLYVPAKATQQQKDIVRLALIWFMVTFTLFSLMVTKFHHYIFPAVPSAALLIGLLLHRMLGDKSLEASPRGAAAMGSLVVGVAMLVLGVTNFFGSWSGRVPHEAPFHLPPGNGTVGVVLLAMGVAAVILSAMLSSRSEVPVAPAPGEIDANAESSPTSDAVRDYAARYGAVALGAVGIGAAVLLALIARDIGMPTSRPTGSERFIHLFIYNYDRQFPSHSFDYHAILTGFGVVAVLAAASLAIHPARRMGARALLALAMCFGFWTLDKYMMDLSNHWSQRNLFDRYYAIRHVRTEIGYGEDARYWSDAIAAFQMNWKGENFYTGNHAAMLECGLPLCKEHTNEWFQRHRGERVFIVTEHSRVGSISGQVRQAAGSGATSHPVTDEFDNNKFVLIEAQL